MDVADVAGVVARSVVNKVSLTQPQVEPDSAFNTLFFAALLL